jgi:ParB family chromosome partitioning protein
VTDKGSRTTGERSARPRRGGLGRGLDSLIPTAPVAAPHEAASDSPYLEVPVHAIDPNPYQPRASIDDTQLDELAESIRQHGLMQPLVVTPSPKGDRWVLIAGERRWRAAKRAGLSTIPILVKDAAPLAMLELAIIENVVRSDLSPLEEALAFQQLIEEFGLSQQQVADRLGRSRVAVTNTLRLLAAPERVQRALSAGQISEGHARAILGLHHSPDQVALLELVVEKGLSVRQTEQLVRDWSREKRTDVSKPPVREPDEIRIEDRLRTALGTRVALKRASRGDGGSITIQFHSDEQLQAIYDRLVGEEHW